MIRTLLNPACLISYGSPVSRLAKMPNLWLGVSAETQELADKRVTILCHLLANPRFVSIEPQLEAIKLNLWDWPAHDCIRWVICGGENGNGARPFDMDWARSLRDECQAACVPFFFKGPGGGNKSPIIDGVPWQQFPESMKANA